MLKELNADQVRFVALLAKTVRAQRDSLSGDVPEDELAKELNLARGAHNPTGTLEFAPLAVSAPVLLGARPAMACFWPGPKHGPDGVAGKTGKPSRISFTDPDAVIAIDAIDSRAGLALWARKESESELINSCDRISFCLGPVCAAA